jgi:putative transposase
MDLWAVPVVCGAGVPAGRLVENRWYRPARGNDQSVLRLKIREIAYARPRFGYQRIHVMLARQGW